MLKGKTALVTGSIGGIGYATAEIRSADGRAIARGDATFRFLSQKQ